MRQVFSRLLFGVLLVPLSSEKPSNWTELQFRKIKSNHVEFGKTLNIKVSGSASPLIYRLPGEKPRKVKSVKVRARWSGKLNLPSTNTQGEKGADDFVFKVGLIIPGKSRLNFFQRKLAADWILQLEKMAPADMGLDHVLFLTAVSDTALLGKTRKHPLSDLLHDRYVTVVTEPGEFEIRHEFGEPISAVGLWISADGDDTNSEFQVEIFEIEVQSPGA